MVLKNQEKVNSGNHKKKRIKNREKRGKHPFMFAV